jgi:hypothetical protein
MAFGKKTLLAFSALKMEQEVCPKRGQICIRHYFTSKRTIFLQIWDIRGGTI